MSHVYRPWGQLSWVLENLNLDTWSFLGCLSPEERSISTWEHLNKNCNISDSEFLQIDDPPSHFDGIIENKIKSNAQILNQIAAPSEAILQAPLFSRHQDIISIIDERCNQAGDNLVIDITSLPKRFFFPMLKRVIKIHKNIKNLVVTYALPDEYSREALSGDAETILEPLPTFGDAGFPMPKRDLAIIGVGFLPMNLANLSSEFRDCEMRLLFPFPPGPPNFNRNWRFVRDFEEKFDKSPLEEPIRVSAYDMPDCFDHICNETMNGGKYTLLLPYGPKPMSLAMCLYAIETGHPVFYTQPKFYNPNYSKGIAKENGINSVYAYLIKADGRSVYSV